MHREKALADPWVRKRLGRCGHRLGGTAREKEEVYSCVLHGAPSDLQRLSIPLLQLHLEPCFSPVAQTRPWWSLVSIVLISSSDPHPPPSLQRPLPPLPTSSPAPSLPPTPPLTAASDTLPRPRLPPPPPPAPPAPGFPRGDAPPSLFSSTFQLYFGHQPPQPTASRPSRFLPEPPSHGGWRSCLCPALHPANPEVGERRTKEREPLSSLFPPFHTVHSFFFP